jgi:glycosyltransferase involved in cell wall biosynthesis
MRIIVIGNYPADKQESMERFALMLDTALQLRGLDSEVWRPKVILGAWFKSTTVGAGKWFAYIDKWLIFPLILYWRFFNQNLLGTNVRFHICDQGNAPYLMFLPINRTVITCHDVLAIRSALGYSDSFTSVSAFGRYYQKWILYYLNKAAHLASVSACTMYQLQELLPDQRIDVKNWHVIHNSFNAHFRQIKPREAELLISKRGLSGKSFILHVGSGSPRKNRKMLLKIVNVLGNQWQGQICLAGEEIEAELYDYAELLGLSKRLISVIKPDHDTLVALYNTCEAFIFPSFSEGFGWPMIEAQSCGCPVIASNIQPMLEVCGDGALYASPHNPQDFATAFLLLKDKDIRRQLINQGHRNTKRFEPKQMIDGYIKLHCANQTEFSRYT